MAVENPIPLEKTISRREFLRNVTTAGAGLVFGASIFETGRIERDRDDIEARAESIKDMSNKTPAVDPDQADIYKDAAYKEENIKNRSLYALAGAITSGAVLIVNLRLRKPAGTTHHPIKK